MCLPYSFFPVFPPSLLFPFPHSFPPSNLFFLPFLISFLSFPLLSSSFSPSSFPHLPCSLSTFFSFCLLPAPPPFSYSLHSFFPRPSARLCLSLLRPTPAVSPRPVLPRPSPPRLRGPGGAAEAACPGGAERAGSGEHSVPERPRPPTCAPARSAAREQWLHCCGGWRESPRTLLVAG